MLRDSVSMRYISLSLGVFLLLTRVSLGQGDFDITSSVDREKLTVGDKLSLTLIAKNSKNIQVEFPDKPGDIGQFTFVKALPHKGSNGRAGITYVLSIFDPGTYILPEVQVKYRKQGENDWRVFNTKRLSVEVSSLLKGNEKDIRDIKGLINLPSRIGIIILLIILLMAAIGIIIFIKSGGKLLNINQKKELKPPHIIAYEELERLKAEDLPGKGKVREYYFALSDIIRHYLENRFMYKAPEMTTEEFLDFIKRAPELKNEERPILKKFLTNCDMVKFARYSPLPIEILDAFRLAEDLVDMTKPVATEEVKV